MIAESLTKDMSIKEIRNMTREEAQELAEDCFREEQTLIRRMSYTPPASITRDEIDGMLLEIKVILVSITNALGDSPADPELINPLAPAFATGYSAPQLSDLISITDDDDSNDLSVGQRLRHIYLRVKAISAGVNYLANKSYEKR